MHEPKLRGSVQQSGSYQAMSIVDRMKGRAEAIERPPAKEHWHGQW
jgi:hypothetical protein